MLNSMPFKYPLNAIDGMYAAMNSSLTTIPANTSPCASNSALPNYNNQNSSSSLSGRYYGNKLCSDADYLSSQGKSDENLFKKRKESLSSNSDNEDKVSSTNCLDLIPRPLEHLNKQRFFIASQNISDQSAEAAEGGDIFLEHSISSLSANNINNSILLNNLNDNGGEAWRQKNEWGANAGEDVENSNFLGLLNTPTKLNDDPYYFKKYGVRRHHSAPQSDLKCLQVYWISINKKIPFTKFHIFEKYFI